MEFTSDHSNREAEIIALFTSTFTASEGEDEGRLVGRLARDLMATTSADDLFVLCALEGDEIVGCILFSRLRLDAEARTVFLLSPVAVATGRQGQGVGRKLIARGLDTLRRHGVDVAVTYGDPAYYGRVGFQPVTAEQVRPPLPLSHPEGWLAQSLTGQPLAPLEGPSRCAPALDRPDYW